MSFKDKWESVQRKGKAKFFLKRSAIFAAAWTIIFSACMLMQKHTAFSGTIIYSDIVISFISSLIVGFIIGLLLAEGQWVAGQRKYDRIIRIKESA